MGLGVIPLEIEDPFVASHEVLRVVQIQICLAHVVVHDRKIVIQFRGLLIRLETALELPPHEAYTAEIDPRLYQRRIELEGLQIGFFGELDLA